MSAYDKILQAMLKIKLMPVGKKPQRQYRIAVAEENSKLTGRATAVIGFYIPKSAQLTVDRNELSRWLKVGAQPTPTLRKLLEL